MKKIRLLWLCVFLLMGTLSQAQNTADTRLLTNPAISDTHIAFVYAEDLWIANQDGSYPRRLTIDEGIERSPVFSDDGQHIAFSAEYDGNVDVYVVAASGGIPQRLTWHPGADWVPERVQALMAFQLLPPRRISHPIPLQKVLRSSLHFYRISSAYLPRLRNRNYQVF